jgi:phosphatidate cytidylyltransferase
MAHVSPSKTVEGLLGGALGAVIASVVFNELLGSNPWEGLGPALELGLVVALMAPLGDLAESLLKRDLGIKDMGTILPGHGGVLDRFDALLFTLPGVYFLALALDILPG